MELLKNEPSMKIIRFSSLALFLGCILSSCASVSRGSFGNNRDIAILSEPSGAEIYLNKVPKGVTPTKLQMSVSDLTRGQLTLVKKGYKPISFKAQEALDGMILGNVVAGGLVGAVFDGLTGNAITTKDTVMIKLEKGQ
ncbi:PEGA domain-containing protein [Akkermansiaceae bacterium]|nr:PEGA domain-containing protein [Akkermansiaceae bacterium]